MKVIIWIIGASIVALGIFVSVSLDETQRTLPKIKLSYFADENEIAASVSKRLFQEIGRSKFYWIGIEPVNDDHVLVAMALKAEIEKLNGKFSETIIDSELKLSEVQKNLLGVTQNVFLKDNLQQVGEVLSMLERENRSYFLVTASIYSNSFIKDNQIHEIKKKYLIKPMTISLGLYSALVEEEPNLIFPCDTEDKSGVSNWGCAIANKGRSTRRKFEKQNPKPWSGLLDLSGENDYMLLVRKK